MATARSGGVSWGFGKVRLVWVWFGKVWFTVVPPPEEGVVASTEG